MLSDYRLMYASYLHQPVEVSLETLARCNAACTFCPYSTLERIGTKMPDALIERLIGEMAEWERPFVLSPFKVNEPLLDVRLRDICNQFLDKCEMGTLRLFTNGSPLTLKHVEWIAALSRVEHLWVSLNEYRPAEYKALMDLPFERTASNLDALHQKVIQGEFPHKVVISTVGGPNKEFKDYVAVRWPRFSPTIIKKDAWLTYTEPAIKIVPDSPCIRWFELSVMADGKVATCCMHDGSDPQYNIGDVNHQTLLEIYNSPHWSAPRLGLLSRRTLDSSYPCSKCTYALMLAIPLGLQLLSWLAPVLQLS